MRTLLFVAAGATALACSTPRATSQTVTVERLPSGGVGPQAIADADGIVHLVYFTGAPAAGDVYYIRRTVDGQHATPVRVNSQPGSAISVGSIRGPQLALGDGGRVHVIWNGSREARPRPDAGMPVLYSRQTDTGGFEAQRNLVTRAVGTDGGGTIAAGADGRVFVAWHADSETPGEAHRTVFLTRSDDAGKTFSPEIHASPERLGACACCSMRAIVDRAGTLFMLYRSAGDAIHRDMTLVTSQDRGATFSVTPLDLWQLEACPMSSASLAEGPRGVTGAWETQGQIRFTEVTSGSSVASTVQNAPGSGRRKHPVLAYNRLGERLLAWAEDTGWEKGGSIAWQLYDATGRETTERGTASGLPIWGLVAVAPLPDGRFLLVY